MVFSVAFAPFVASQGGEEPEAVQANRIAVLDTDFGIIKFELYEDWAPITTQHFIELAESGHYGDVLFHRIVDDFVIQTGDGGGSQSILLEIHPNATHIDGAVGMARSEDPDSGEDQFYICDGPQHGLDGDYTVFGVVTEGMEVVRQIAEVPVWGENNPRPGNAVPSIWHNVGKPKEDVVLREVFIEAPEIDETATGDHNVNSERVDIPLWAIGFAIVSGAVVLLVLYRGKRRSKAVWGD